MLDIGPDPREVIGTAGTRKRSGVVAVPAGTRIRIYQRPGLSTKAELLRLRSQAGPVLVDVVETTDENNAIITDLFDLAPGNVGGVISQSGGPGLVQLSASTTVFATAREVDAVVAWQLIDQAAQIASPPKSVRIPSLTEGGGGVPGPWTPVGTGDAGRPWVQCIVGGQGDTLPTVGTGLDAQLRTISGAPTIHTDFPLIAGLNRPFILPPTHELAVRAPGTVAQPGAVTMALFCSWGGMR